MALRFACPVANGALCQGRRVSAARPTICRAQQAQRVRSSVQKGQPDDDQEFDSQVLLKYVGAVPLQVGIMSGALWGVQQGAQLLMTTDALPEGVSGYDAARLLVTLFFLVISIRSRIFSPLPASRPSLNSEKADKAAGLRPWWCPPGIAFPIGWTTVGLLRAISSVSVWEASGRDAMTLPLIMMLVQLSCGDCWNHIRNVEQRIGVATTGMIVNVATFYATVWAYYQVEPSAGLILAPSAVWITFAATIVWGIWDLSARPPLYPTKGESRLALELQDSR